MPAALKNNAIDQELSNLAGKSFTDHSGPFGFRPLISNASLTDEFEEIRKGRYQFIKDAWLSLSPTDLASFVSVAGNEIEAANLFTTANLNLILARESMISNYPGTSSPGTMDIDISNLTTTKFEITASGAITTVPAGTTLLILATYQRKSGQIFTDPNNYSPIAQIAEGTDLSSPLDLIDEWKEYFGQITLSKQLCIKSVLIDNSNGARGTAYFSCAVASPVIDFFIFDDSGNFLIDEVSNFLTYPNH